MSMSRGGGGGGSRSFSGGQSRSGGQTRSFSASPGGRGGNVGGANVNRGNFTSRNFGSSRTSNYGGTNRTSSISGRTGSSGSNRANFTSRNFANSGNANFANRTNANNFNRGGNFNRNGFNNFNNGFNNGGFGRGYGGLGYGRGGYGWGYPGYGYGLGGFGWGLPLLWGLGYGGWGGYGGYGYGGYGGYGGGYGGNYAYTDVDNNSYSAAPGTPSADQLADSSDFVLRGEQAFEAGNYQQALKDWQHSMVDNPNNGGVVLLMAQALFAQGQFGPAANTVQMGMQMLPDTEWGNVVKHYTEIYPNIELYTTQLKALEKARDAKPDDGAKVPARLPLRLPGLSEAGGARARQGAGHPAAGRGVAEIA